MSRVVDYYAGHPRSVLQCFRDDHGVQGIARYLVNDPGTDPRAARPYEIADAHALGLAVHFWFEMDPTTSAYFTHARGLADCQAAIAHLDLIGAPAGTVVYFAIDAPASVIPPPAIVPYFNAVEQVAAQSGGRIIPGLYGFEDHVEFARTNFPNIGRHLAQTYGTPRGPLDLWQHEQDTFCGVQVDIDECTAPGWRGEGGADMAISTAQYMEKDAVSGNSLEDLVKGTIRVIYANEIAPALEAEITQRIAAGERNAIAKAVKAVGDRLVAP